MKATIVILLLVSVTESVLWFAPISSESLWPARMIAHELWPWLIALNLLGILLAIFRLRWTILFFAAGLAITVWPLAQIRDLENDVAGQWVRRDFSPETLRIPGTFGVFLRSFTAVDPDTPDLAAKALRPDILLYKAPDTAGREPLPIVVDIHGGSWQHENAETDRSFASHMAWRGYAVFSIDYRKAPAFQYPAQIEDVRAAIAWIAANAPYYGGDPTRMALVGRSSGAQLATLFAYTNEVTPVRGVVSYYGPADLADMYANPPKPDPIKLRAKLETFLGGTPEEVPAAYHDASPVSHLRANLPPTLLIQGADDDVVLPKFVRDMHQDLKESGSRSILVELPWSGHSFDAVYFGPGNILTLAYVESFLADVMSAAEPPVRE
jgi:acetyl esterase/lipase